MRTSRHLVMVMKMKIKLKIKIKMGQVLVFKVMARGLIDGELVADCGGGGKGV